MQLMQTEESSRSSSKNAMHLAAWKGDLDTTKLLVETGKTYKIDLVNMISTGEGNYGKTPLFYAITQDRDDVVLYLLSQNATTLIVNNKGQTPCSLAVTHLTPETRNILEQRETGQLRNGEKFVNYRESHSDRRKYGDLDPRFAIDEANDGDDIREELESFRREQLQIGSGDSDIPLLPRSVRLTSKDMRTQTWLEQQESLITSAKRTRVLKLKANDQADDLMLNSFPTATPTLPANDEPPCSIQKTSIKSELHEAVRDVVALTLAEVLGVSRPPEIEDLVVDNITGLERLLLAVHSSLIENVSGSSLGTLWGLDCEWKPVHMKGGQSPVATLQLSSTTGTFLVDLQTVCQKGLMDAAAPMTQSERVLNESLRLVFESPSTSVVGFGVGVDVARLAASFPHLPCFQLITNVIDLPVVKRTIYPNYPGHHMSSLQKMVLHLLDRHLDKSQQCSDWESRPLTPEQICYATLDAAVLPVLLNKMLDSASDPAAKQVRKTRSSYRFTILEKNESWPQAKYWSYVVKMGSIKDFLNVKIAKQIWPSGRNAPELPRMTPLELSSMEKAPEQFSDRQLPKSAQEKVVSLETFSCDPTKLPPPGTVLGSTKESCISHVLGSELLRLFPDGCDLSFDKRGGIVKMKNAFVLFVTLSNSGSRRKYRNEFSADGRQFTFNADSGTAAGRSLLHALSIETANLGRISCYLFARQGKDKHFMFCGECKEVSRTEGNNGETILALELLQLDSILKGSVGIAYRDMVHLHQTSLQEADHMEASAERVSLHGDSTGINKMNEARQLTVNANNLFVDTATLPCPGTSVGKHRESCIRFTLGRAILPKNAKLVYCRQHPIVLMENASLLFIICGQSVHNKNYRVKFEGGRYITLLANPQNHEGKLLIEAFDNSTASENNSRKILLFLQPMGNSMFVFCGEAKAIIKSSTQDNIAELKVELTSLDSWSEAGESFASIVKTHDEAVQSIDEKSDTKDTKGLLNSMAIISRSDSSNEDLVCCMPMSLRRLAFHPTMCGSLPFGTFVASSKVRCIREVLGKSLLNSLPLNFKFTFDTNSDIVEMSNSLALVFVSVGNAMYSGGKHRNELHEDGTRLAFSVRPEMLNAPYFLEMNKSGVNDHRRKCKKQTLFLFVQPPESADYMFCGRCVVHPEDSKQDDALRRLTLCLTDLDPLETKGLSTFANLGVIDALIKETE